MVMSKESNRNPAAATPMINLSAPFNGVLSIARPMISGVKGAGCGTVFPPESDDALAEHEVSTVALEPPHAQDPGRLVRRHPARGRVNIGVLDVIQSEVAGIAHG